jgi:hypothetical protein
VYFSEVVLVDSPVEETTARRLTWLAAEQGQAAAADAMTAGGKVMARAGFAGLSKTVEIRTSPPDQRGDITMMALRWSATGPFVSLFPVLVAFLEISEAVTGQTRVALIGSYRAPLGPAGELLDRAVLHKAGLVTIRRWLRAASAAATTTDHEQDSTQPQSGSADAPSGRR